MAAPNDRSAVVSRRPVAVTDPWPRNAVAIPASSTDAGACRTSRPALAGSDRRAGDAPQDEAPMTGLSSARAPADRGQEPTALADDLADRPGADRRQLATQVLGDRREVAHDVVGRAGELGPQVLALGGDPGRDTCRGGTGGPCRSRWRRAPRSRTRTPRRRGAPRRAGRGPVWSPPSERSRDAVAQVVAEQDLVDLGEPELPRRPDVLDRRQRRCAGPAGMTGQVDVRGAGLGDASRDRPDPARRRRASRRSARPG